MIEQIDKSWQPILHLLYQEPLNTLREDILPNISFQPLKEDIFRVFEIPVDKIKVVILGQEPHHNGTGNGLAYAVKINPYNTPIYLQQIHTEVVQEGYMGGKFHYDGWKTLEHWKKQGVFLLNTALTVETGKAGSHLKYWEEFTKKVISYISIKNPCIWLLWGRKAQKFIPYIKSCPFITKGYNKTTIQDIPANKEWNYVLTAPHPAAETYTGGKAGFYGCNHFLYANEILKKLKHKPINW